MFPQLRMFRLEAVLHHAYNFRKGCCIVDSNSFSGVDLWVGMPPLVSLSGNLSAEAR
jgi:hypothetical protein